MIERHSTHGAATDDDSNGTGVPFVASIVTVSDHKAGSAEGWAVVREERRHIGFSLARYRQLHPTAHNGRMARSSLPPLWTAYLVAASIASNVRRSLRFGRVYGLRRFEAPIVWLCSGVTHLMEIPDVLTALRGQEVGRWSTYR